MGGGSVREEQDLWLCARGGEGRIGFEPSNLPSPSPPRSSGSHLLISIRLRRRPAPRRVRHVPPPVHLPLQVRPPLPRLPRCRPERARPLRHADDSVEDRVELGLGGGGAEVEDELAAGDVEGLVELGFGDAPGVEGGAYWERGWGGGGILLCRYSWSGAV